MDENNNVVSVNNKKGGMMVWIVIIVLIIAAVLGYFVFGKNKLGILGSNTATSTASAATVNGVAIPQATYDTQLAAAIANYKTQGVDVASTTVLAQIKTQVIEGLISNELVEQGVKASGIVTLPADVDKQIEATKTQLGGVDKFQAELVKNNLTEAKLRENIAKQLATQAYLLKNIDVSSIKITDAQIAQFYADYSKAQKAAGEKTVPALKDLSAQIKQQLTSNEQQALVNSFIAGLRAKATVVITAK